MDLLDVEPTAKRKSFIFLASAAVLIAITSVLFIYTLSQTSAVSYPPLTKIIDYPKLPFVATAVVYFAAIGILVKSWLAEEEYVILRTILSIYVIFLGVRAYLIINTIINL